MPRPTCPKPGCGSTRFQSARFEPTDAVYALVAHQCADCGAVVGVTQFHDAGTLLKQLTGKIDNLQSRVDWLIANRR